MSTEQPVASGQRTALCFCPCFCSSATETSDASVHLVKDRDPGSSEQLHRSGERSPGRSESLTCLDQEQPQVIGVGEALFPRPSDPLAKGGDDKGQSPLVLGQMGVPVAVGGTLLVRLRSALSYGFGTKEPTRSDVVICTILEVLGVLAAIDLASRYWPWP